MILMMRMLKITMQRQYKIFSMLNLPLRNNLIFYDPSNWPDNLNHETRDLIVEKKTYKGT